MTSESYEYLAGHDPLTGLMNRRSFESDLDAAVLAVARDERPAVALLYLDLNGFKRVNDSLGHALGDELLRIVARRLLGAMRWNERLGRLGGDEFAVLVESVTGVEEAGEQAEALAHRLSDALRAPFALGEIEILVGAAIGVSTLPGDAHDSETLAKHADAAMYEAKRTGASVLVHCPTTPDPLERVELAARLRRAVERNHLVIHYQPIVRLPDERIMGVEALVRWEDPELGTIMPDRFIGVAESTGVIESLGEWVFEATCAQAALWEARGLSPNFGYNVSERQLRRPGLAARLAARARHHGIDPARFICELTETTWADEAGRIRVALDELRAAGFVLAIDDFGSGYSSLWRLRELDVDVIKVDRALLRGVPEDARATAVLSAITQLAQACECDVVAEGVETAAQRDYLVDQGCRLAQGYLFARPVPAGEIERLLRKQLVDDRRLERGPTGTAGLEPAISRV